MRRFTLGILLGIVIGAVDVVLMLPLSFPDKRAALAGAFVSRFSLGFFAATVLLPVSPVIAGIVVGMLTSVPDAIITKAYTPIAVSGVVFGAAAGWIVGRWAR
jgi:membrane protein YqaA with SNARE-associated domain